MDTQKDPEMYVATITSPPLRGVLSLEHKCTSNQALRAYPDSPNEHTSTFLTNHTIANCHFIYTVSPAK